MTHTRRGLSIEYRLPLIIGVVLLLVIAAMSTAVYGAMRSAAFESAGGRLRSVTTQFRDLFQQSGTQLRTSIAAIAAKPEVVAFARSHDPRLRAQALAALQPPAGQAETFIATLMRDSTGAALLATTTPDRLAQLPRRIVRTPTSSRDSVIVGAFQVWRDTLVYPVTAAIPGVRGVYLVSWRRLVGSARQREQINKLIGSGASLFLGNARGPEWTDLERRIPPPPVRLDGDSTLQTYHRASDGREFLSSAALVRSTPWMVVIAFPTEPILAQVSAFMWRLIAIAIVALLLGLTAAWMTSRNITQAVVTLTRTADAVAVGDHTRRANIRRDDELGRLGRAFDSMMDRLDESNAQLRKSAAELEQRVEQRTHDLAVANRELESFAYSVSHDLRTPLRALDGFSVALIEEYGGQLDAVAHDYLTRIRRASQRMGNLIDALLALSRVSRGTLRAEPIDLSALANDVVTQLRAQTPEREVSVQVEPGLGTVGDPILLRALLDNLLSNAWKYTGKTSRPRVEFSKATVPGRNGHTYVVRDNGAGFDMSHAAKLFGAFQRLHSNDEFEGTGVGLATAQRIVHRHGGEIWADATPNAGAAFYFTLG